MNLGCLRHQLRQIHLWLLAAFQSDMSRILAALESLTNAEIYSPACVCVCARIYCSEVGEQPRRVMFSLSV